MIVRTFRGITYTVIPATSNDQVINGTRRPDWIEVLGGNNIVLAGASNDVVLAGVDFLSIGNFEPFGGEAIFFSPRSDGGNNIINVGAGDDYVVSGRGNDAVFLGEGNDIFDGAFFSQPGGNDTIYAGAVMILSLHLVLAARVFMLRQAAIVSRLLIPPAVEINTLSKQVQVMTSLRFLLRVMMRLSLLERAMTASIWE